MIPHIRKSAEFRKVLSRGNRARKKDLEIIKMGANGSNPAVGIIISKKFSPKATQRNYVRRVIYRYFDDCLKGRKTADMYVVKVIGSLKDKKKGTLSKEIRNTLSQILQKHE